MTTKSEDVLLQMGEVRYKKGDGTLYVMNERLAWMVEHRDTVAVSHKFQDIKMQKISPEGKPKIQLQVVLHDGNSSTFHFVNRSGSSAQIEDRDKVKELLQSLLPTFKRKVDKELEEKNRVLSENSRLLQMYKDLVITQVLTSEEFWAMHAKQPKDEGTQVIGVSGAFLADIKPQTDGCNGLKYNLTADIIECIFKTYPAVRRKHTENVGGAKMTESEFWTKFFQSHYFHRDRITGGNKDLFSECGKMDDSVIKAAVAASAGDPLLDLNTFEDNTLEDGFATALSSKNAPINSGNIVHQSMIKRFNQHSMMVLRTCSNPALANGALASDVDATKNGYARTSKERKRDPSPPPPEPAEIEPSVKRARIAEKIVYDDLCSTDQSTRLPDKLNLTKIERYLHGPVASAHNYNSGSGSGSEDSFSDLGNAQAQVLQSTDGWAVRTPAKCLVSATSAVNVLGELSPGGALMRGFQEQSLAQLVPIEVQKELRHIYLSLAELLKSFWHSFPPTTPELELRVVRMHEALQRYQIAKLKPFEDRVMRELLPLGSSLTLHINQLLQAAARKFGKWQEIKLRQHR